MAASFLPSQSSSPGLQYATTASGLITIIFGLRASFFPLVHFRGLGINTANLTTREQAIIHAGAHAIAVRTVAMGVLVLISAYRATSEVKGWMMLGMTAVMYVDGLATRVAVKMVQGGNGRGSSKGWIGPEWIHWGSVPVFASLAVAYLRDAYGRY